VPRKAKQSAFLSLNLRLPPELHRKLVKSAGTTRSLNAEILDRLEKSLESEKTAKAQMRILGSWKRDLEQQRKAFPSRVEEKLDVIERRIDKLEQRLRDKEQ
jgi:hypothetical protein